MKPFQLRSTFPIPKTPSNHDGNPWSIIIILLIATAMGCTKENTSAARACLDYEYVIDDLGRYVTYTDFEYFRFYYCQVGDVLLVKDNEVVHSVLNQPFDLYELEIEAFDGESELWFKAAGLYFVAYIRIDEDRRTTTIEEVSDVCVQLEEHL